jgi:hypothetical protein
MRYQAFPAHVRPDLPMNRHARRRPAVRTSNTIVSPDLPSARSSHLGIHRPPPSTSRAVPPSTACRQDPLCGGAIGFLHKCRYITPQAGWRLAEGPIRLSRFVLSHIVSDPVVA